jgi:phage tail sheath protein FI
MPHGITLTESISGTRTISTRSSAIIGLIGTSTAIAPENQAAIDAAFPLDTPVLFTSAAVAAGKAGSGGTLKAALTAIDDIVTPTIIVVRVAVGEDAQAQDAAVIGATDGATYTGMQALLKAEAQTGYRPRILGAPGLDSEAVTTKLAILAKAARLCLCPRDRRHQCRGAGLSRKLRQPRTDADLARQLGQRDRRRHRPRHGPARLARRDDGLAQDDQQRDRAGHHHRHAGCSL